MPERMREEIKRKFENFIGNEIKIYPPPPQNPPPQHPPPQHHQQQ
jgi:hypothetical protein